MNRFDEFLVGYEPGQLEETRKVQTVGSDLSELMRKYELVLDDSDLLFGAAWKDFIYHNQKITEFLTQAEINSFLQTTKQYEDYPNYNWNTGMFLSCLIQISYNHGYNHFFLDTKNVSTISGLAAFIIGQEQKPIHITIHGNVGNSLGNCAQHSIFTLNGSALEMCGFGAYKSIFTFNGGIGHNFGLRADLSTFILNDIVAETFVDKAFSCTFKTSKLEYIEKLKKNIPKGNTLIYIDNGKEARIV